MSKANILLNDKVEYTKKEFVVDLIIGFTALILVAFLFFTSTFWISTVCVQQTSMTNTLQEGDVLVLDKLAKVERGDIIVFKQTENEDYIKRVIAVEGDTVYTIDGKVWIEYYENGKKVFKQLDEPYLKHPFNGTYVHYSNKVEISRVTIGKGQYFVLGDNRMNSTDSRTYFNQDGSINTNVNDATYVGLVSEEDVLGVVHEFWVAKKDVTTKIFGKNV